MCCHRRLLYGRSADPEADRLKGVDFTRRALEVAGDPGVLVNATSALAYFDAEIGAMLALVDGVLMLNPNFGCGWHISGNFRVWRASQKSRSNTSRPRYASHHGPESAHRFEPQASRIFSAGASTKQCRDCFSRSKRIPVFRTRIAFSPAVTPICVGSTRHVRNRNAVAGHYSNRNTRRRLCVRSCRSRVTS
jgi:hypothetical protein